MQIIGNVNHVFPNTLVVQALQNISTTAQEQQIFYDRFCSDIIYKAIEGSIKNTSLKILSLNLM